MAGPDPSAFARRHAVALGLVFLGLLAVAGWRGNAFAGLAGVAGLAWVIWAHLERK